MNYFPFSKLVRRVSQIAALLAILFSSLGGTTIAYAAPSNDNFSSATVVSSIPYTDSLSTTTATEEANDPIVPAPNLCDGKQLHQGDKSVWYRYTPGTNALLSIDTLGSDYDTYIAIWTGSSLTSLSFVACDDDTTGGQQSQLVLSPTAGTTYYIEVAGYTGKGNDPDQPNSGGALVFHIRLASKTEVWIGTGAQPKGTYNIPAVGQITPSYPGEFNGPVRVRSINGKNIFTSERAIFGNSFTETLGVPGNQLATDYWFPWYDGVTMRTWVSIGAPTTNIQTALVDIYIGTTKMNANPFPVVPGGQWSPFFDGVFNGPVHVVSTNGQNLIVSERAIYGSSFTETPGVPGNQLTTEYWFTWYDTSTMRTWISVGAPSTNTQNALVDIYIGTTKMNATSYQVAPGGQVSPTPYFSGMFNGPVRVVSTNGQNIFASERAIFGSSFTETIGIPGNQLTTNYWFTFYDGVTMNTWITVGAPTTNVQDALVDIYIGGTKVNPTSYQIAPGGQVNPPFPGTFDGPVQVVSTNGQNIFASQRSIFGASFAETLGMGENRLTTDYWFSWYDWYTMHTWVTIGAP